MKARTTRVVRTPFTTSSQAVCAAHEAMRRGAPQAWVGENGDGTYHVTFGNAPTRYNTAEDIKAVYHNGGR